MDRENPLVRQGKKTVIYGLSLLMLAAMVTACLQPLTLMPLPEQLSLMQVESPLVPEEILLLTKNPWRVVTIVYQNETVAFDAIQPIYVKVGPRDLSAETGCNHLGFKISVEDNQQHQLTEGVSTLALCPEVQAKQYSRFYTVLSNTNRFELQNEQVILIGNESRIVL